jgi:hypothetical protein
MLVELRKNRMLVLETAGFSGMPQQPERPPAVAHALLIPGLGSPGKGPQGLTSEKTNPSSPKTVLVERPRAGSIQHLFFLATSPMDTLEISLALMTLTMLVVTIQAIRLGNEKRDVAFLGMVGGLCGVGTVAATIL